MEGWAIRAGAAVVFSLSCALAGHAMSVQARRRALYLGQLRAALARLEVYMLEQLLPLDEALKEVKHPLFARVGEAVASGAPAREGWAELERERGARGGALDCLSGEDITCMRELFEELGMSLRQTQKILLNQAARTLARLEETAIKEAAERGRLYTSLGLLIGLMLSVCLM